MMAPALQSLGFSRRRLLVRIAAGGTLALLLSVITASYLEPGFVVMMANQLWTCF